MVVKSMPLSDTSSMRFPMASSATGRRSVASGDQAAGDELTTAALIGTSSWPPSTSRRGACHAGSEGAETAHFVMHERPKKSRVGAAHSREPPAALDGRPERHVGLVGVIPESQLVGEHARQRHLAELVGA